MRPRTEAFLALGALAVLATVAAIAGRARAPAEATADLGDPSTFRTDPGGARALLEAAQQLGVDVLRFRDRSASLATLAHRPQQLLALIGPTSLVAAPDIPLLLQFHRSADLLLAGLAADNVMRCFGYKVRPRPFDSLAVAGAGAAAPYTHATLVATGETTHIDSSREADVGRISCKVPAYAAIDTLLTSTGGAVMVRITGDSGRRTYLVADAALLSNASLRRSGAGPFFVGLIAGSYRQVIFDEYHHGYGASGSLPRAVLEWSRESPWGWAAWQLALVGVLALLFGAVRFGPPIVAISRTRRSSLEHVGALATALSAAQGHDQAIAAMVRGLRRRLVPPAMRSRGDWKTWLAARDRPTASPVERSAVATLTTLIQPGQPQSSVLRAADAVEDLWESLQH